MDFLLNAGPAGTLFWVTVGAALACAACFIQHRWWPRNVSPKSKAADDAVAGADEDQLEAIEGIGADIAELLRGQNTRTFAQLAATTVDQLRGRLKAGGDRFRLNDPASWPTQAKLLAAGNTEGFLKLAVKLRAGVATLEHLSGIGEATADKLRRDNSADDGLHSIQGLVGLSVDALMSKLATVGEGRPRDTVEKALREAKAFHDGNVDAYLQLAEVSSVEWREPGRVVGRDATDDAIPLQAERDGNDTQPARDPGCDCGSWGKWLLGGLASVLALVCVFAGSEPVGTVCKRPNYCQLTRECPKCPEIATPLAITIPGETLFEHDQSEAKYISPEGRAFLTVFQLTVDAITQQTPSQISIVGHADRSGAYANERHNQALSEQRAQSVKDELAKLSDRWKDIPTTVSGRGSQDRHGELTANCKSTGRLTARDKDCLSPDRRVDIRLTMTPKPIVANLVSPTATKP